MVIFCTEYFIWEDEHLLCTTKKYCLTNGVQYTFIVLVCSNSFDIYNFKTFVYTEYFNLLGLFTRLSYMLGEVYGEFQSRLMCIGQIQQFFQL